MTLQPLILNVLWIDTHSCIAHDGLWTCCCHYGIVAFLVLVEHLTLFSCQHNRVCLLIGNIILQMVEL